MSDLRNLGVRMMDLGVDTVTIQLKWSDLGQPEFTATALVGGEPFTVDFDGWCGVADAAVNLTMNNAARHVRKRP